LVHVVARHQLRLDDVLMDAGRAVERGHPGWGRDAERDELMTADEVAARLRMTKGWVYAETRLDRIPHLRLGRYFRYRRSAIESWIVELEGSRQDQR
jgi:excisionase family DNA binding protein